MKTADLIPLILLELNECDKYGFELTKNIETKSNGQIIIKQPTLYSLLKKLEKSKFITSYWEDSEIGGKRHYYKLTENGKIQVSTLPSYNDLLQNCNCEVIDDNNQEVTTTTAHNFHEEKKTSIMDEFIISHSTPVETIIPTEEVFADNDLDTSTETDINIANTEILKNKEEEFAENENVSKFTEKVTPPPAESIKTNQEFNSNLLDVEFAVPKTEIDIKYVDYVNFKNLESYKKSKVLTRNMLWQVLSTSGSLLIIALLCSLITSFIGRTGYFYFFFISSLLVALFYPIIFAVNIDKLRLKFQTIDYKPKTKLKLYIGLTLILLVLIITVIINISLKNNTFGLMLSFKNFASFYSPLLLTSVYFLDVLFNYIFCSKSIK